MIWCAFRKLTLAFAAIVFCLSLHAQEQVWKFKDEMVPALVRAVPVLLKQQNPKTGRFGGGLWIPPDQLPIYPLAAAWAYKDPHNTYYHDAQLLQTIIAGGDQLVGAQDKNGQWEFRKKDNSVWGKHYNPWVYSRWIRTFALIRDGMPKSARVRWEKALTLGYSGVARRELASRIVNIPTHHAMGLYIAGQTLGRPDWCATATNFLQRVAAAQNPVGYWTEHSGPVVSYNFVYNDALGIYYSLSHDEKMVAALERSAQFHANFIYPDGSTIETIDERVPYSKHAHLAGVGFAFSPIGRAYLRDQWKRIQNDTGLLSVDFVASMLLYGEEGPTAELPSHNHHSLFTTSDGSASILRNGPWTTCLSAYTSPLSLDRWIQDRQNFVSLFHEKTGLILGGGNTKLQPFWSTFTVGDTKLLRHKEGDKHPDFSEPKGLLHVPSNGFLDAKDNRLTLRYGTNECSVSLRLINTNHAQLVYAVNPAANVSEVAAHVTFIPELSQPWRTASGKKGNIDKPFELTAADASDWFEHNGWRVNLPKGSRITWPAMRHNPYRDDGRSDLSDARIVLTLPFSQEVLTQSVDIEVLP